MTLLVSKVFKLKLDSLNPVTGEQIAFITLTLPVILYFTLFENGKHAGTIGKRKFGLHVVSNRLTIASPGQLLIRNCI